jgi:hypothetical protein
VLGYYTACTHPKLSARFSLLQKSLAPSSVNSLGSRNNCPVPGTLINTNNMLGFQNLDVASLLREEGKKVHIISTLILPPVQNNFPKVYVSRHVWVCRYIHFLGNYFEPEGVWDLLIYTLFNLYCFLISLLHVLWIQILHDILSGKIEECPSLLLRFLVISFADLKNWKLYYNVAFPSLDFNSNMTLLSLHSASQVLSQEEVLILCT